MAQLAADQRDHHQRESHGEGERGDRDRRGGCHAPEAAEGAGGQRHRKCCRCRLQPRGEGPRRGVEHHRSDSNGWT